MTSGGEVFVSTDLTRFQNTASGISFIPDPAYTSAIRLGINQPLLRGFGTSVNTASIRHSRNVERRSIQQLRADLLSLLDGTERSASVVPVVDLQMLELHRASLLELMGKEPKIAVKIIFSLARMIGNRLRESGDKIKNLFICRSIQNK